MNVTNITTDNLLAQLYAARTEFVTFGDLKDLEGGEETFRVLHSGLFGGSGIKDSVEVFRHVYAGKPLPLKHGLFRASDLIPVAKEAIEHKIENIEALIWLRVCERHSHCVIENDKQVIVPATTVGNTKVFDHFGRMRRYEPFSVFVHLYSHYDAANAETKRRNDFASTTWESHHDANAMVDFKVVDSELNRSSMSIGDKVSIPFVRDLIEKAMAMARQEDIILFTNRDTCLSADACARLVDRFISGTDACYSFRRDFRRLSMHVHPSAIQTGAHYPGCDLFAFRPAWWIEHGDAFPDMLLGYEAWDRVMRELVCTTQTHMDPGFSDLIYHEMHPNGWEHPRVRRSHPCQVYNRQLARSFLLRRLLPLNELAI